MPLSAYQPRSEKVALGKDNDFVVRALTFPAVAALVADRATELAAIVAKYQETRKDITSTKNIGDLVTMVVRDFPNLATEIVSSCIVGETVDAPLIDKIKLLPFPVQLDALLKIGRLTVEEAGGLGNLIADAQKRLAEINEARRQTGIETPTA